MKRTVALFFLGLMASAGLASAVELETVQRGYYEQQNSQPSYKPEQKKTSEQKKFVETKYPTKEPQKYYPVQQQQQQQYEVINKPSYQPQYKETKQPIETKQANFYGQQKQETKKPIENKKKTETKKPVVEQKKKDYGTQKEYKALQKQYKGEQYQNQYITQKKETKKPYINKEKYYGYKKNSQKKYE